MKFPHCVLASLRKQGQISGIVPKAFGVPEYSGNLGGFLSPINLHSLETLLILGMTTKKWKKGHCCEFTSVTNFGFFGFLKKLIWLFQLNSVL